MGFLFPRRLNVGGEGEAGGGSIEGFLGAPLFLCLALGLREARLSRASMWGALACRPLKLVGCLVFFFRLLVLWGLVWQLKKV